MEAWDAICARRDVREFADRPIPESDLERILEAGRRSPSAMNSQPWNFVVCRDRETLRRLADACGAAHHVATCAAAVALVAPERDSEEGRWWVQYDLGQVTMSMMIAATALGIGSSHAGVQEKQAVVRLLGIPEGLFCRHVIAFGYPKTGNLRPIANPKRRPLSDIVHFERW